MIDTLLICKMPYQVGEGSRYHQPDIENIFQITALYILLYWPSIEIEQ